MNQPLLDAWAVVLEHDFGIELLNMEVLEVFSTERRAIESVQERPVGAPAVKIVPLKALPPDADGRSILVEIVGGPYRLAGGFYRSSGNEDPLNLSTKT